ncbi:putative phospholipid-transporting ATPase IC [Platysternon megacephalum]|uniref:Putative phospholipid-transporting ATPase IC n=1 Tax=Platysternon megacephalum TaxID=55544 RepID=A0A4D9DXQ8_9SAUR|nr:putative phospholipid-transporting ATPase IC [Platysternon megacephalum]
MKQCFQNLKIRGEYFSYENVIGRSHSKANPPTDSLSWHLFKIIWLSRLYLRQEAHLTYDSVYYQKGEKTRIQWCIYGNFSKIQEFVALGQLYRISKVHPPPPALLEAGV